MANEILGVRVDGLSIKETMLEIGKAWDRGKPFLIFTPNPEILVKANSDPYFKTVLNSADVNLCDGFGLWLVTRLSFRARAPKAPDEKSLSQSTRTDIPPAVGLTSGRVERVTGVDCFIGLTNLAAKLKWKIFLLGTGDELTIHRVSHNLQSIFPELVVCGYDKGPHIVEGYDKQLIIGTVESENLMKKLSEARPDILVVGFGMGKQEKWIYENASKITGLKVAIGVGGALDYIAGRVPRAPLLMRKIGLEWVYRLYKQPKRIGRIFNATVKFLYYYVRNFAGN